MYIKWLKNKLGEKFYPITHAKAVLFGNSNKTLDEEISDINNSISSHTSNTSNPHNVTAEQTPYDDTKSVKDAIDDVNANFNNLEIGGRNYIGEFNIINLGSCKFDKKSGTLTSVTRSNTGNGYAKIRKYFDGKPIDTSYPMTYTLGYNMFSITKDDSWNQAVIGFNGDKEDATILFDMSSLENGESYIVSFNLQSLSSDGVGNGGKIVGIKLEKGNKPTDWTPAPEDIENEIQSVEHQVTTNLLKPTLGTVTQNGVTCTNNGDGTYTLNGTAIYTTNIIVGIVESEIGAKYKLIGCPQGGTWTANVGYKLYTHQNGSFYIDAGNGEEITSTSEELPLMIQVNTGVECDNLIFKPMITTDLNATYDDFVPFTGTTGKLNGDVAELEKNMQDSLDSIALKYLGRTLGDIIVPETTISVAKDGDNNWYISEKNAITYEANLANDKFLVTIDGVEYSVRNHGYQKESKETDSFYGWQAIGNVSPFGYSNIESKDNSLNFAIIQDYYENAGEVYVIFFNDTSTTHTVSIQRIEDNYSEFPYEFIQKNTSNEPLIHQGSGKDSIMINSAMSANGEAAFAEGANTTADGLGSHAECINTTASGYGSHAEGSTTTASGYFSHAEGETTTASGLNSHAEGQHTTASTQCTHAEGYKSVASGLVSHVEGRETIASGDYSHAEGGLTRATGTISHAEGSTTTASGNSSHAEGRETTASGKFSHAGGKSTVAGYQSQTVIGEYNKNKEEDIFEVGNGTSNEARSNALELTKTGDCKISGDFIDGNGTNMSRLLHKKIFGLTTESYGKKGFINFARLKINDTYVNAPVEFVMICRNRMSCSVSIQFENTDNKDPGIDRLVYNGDDYGVFAVCSDTSTVDLYYTKEEAYGSLCLFETRSMYNDNSMYNESGGIIITYPDIYVAEEPSGAVKATLYGDSGWITHSTVSKLKYRKKNGFVTLILEGAVIPGGEGFAYIPEGYRPSVSVVSAVSVGAPPGTIGTSFIPLLITSKGQIFAQGGSSTTVFGSVTYPV